MVTNGLCLICYMFVFYHTLMDAKLLVDIVGA